MKFSFKTCILLWPLAIFSFTCVPLCLSIKYDDFCHTSITIFQNASTESSSFQFRASQYPTQQIAGPVERPSVCSPVHFVCFSILRTGCQRRSLTILKPIVTCLTVKILWISSSLNPSHHFASGSELLTWSVRSTSAQMTWFPRARAPRVTLLF